jgi:multimeric flavodoxin WrbA
MFWGSRIKAVMGWKAGDMPKIFAINGSPRQSKGNTAKILTPFLDRLSTSGAEVTLRYASRLKIKPCSCGIISCWGRTPGECIHKDAMREILPMAAQSQILVLATPVYIPLPGAMQNFLNRMCPLLDPVLAFKNGRTRARLRQGVLLEKIVLVTTGGWWERANADTVLRIAQELAHHADISFAGSIIRPHANLMWREGNLTEQGGRVIDAIQQAADELLRDGTIRDETQAAISQPLISQEEFFKLRAEG